jgi:hypothetical protein
MKLQCILFSNKQNNKAKNFQITVLSVNMEPFKYIILGEQIERKR